MSAQTWRVVPNAYGATLVVDHSCGHEGRYLYGGEEQPLRDAETEQGRTCLQCRKLDTLLRLKKLTSAVHASHSKVTS